MGREVRRVPKDWEHPRRDNGTYQPLYDEDYKTACAEWKERFAKHPESSEAAKYEYWDWDGPPPAESYHRPKWTDAERTHWQMYETVSEGTPLSPVMESPEALARWLADHGGDAGFGTTCTYEQWLAMIHQGSAPTFVTTRNDSDVTIKSGVEAVSERTRP